MTLKCPIHLTKHKWIGHLLFHPKNSILRVMTIQRHLLTLQIQELFLDSKLPPNVTLMLFNEIDAFFVGETIQQSDSIPPLLQQLYALDDDEYYSIINVSYLDGYQAVLLPALRKNIWRGSFSGTQKYIKETYFNDKEVLREMMDSLNRLTETIQKMLTISTRTTRKAVGITPYADITFPDDETLKLFFECGRKIAYKSLEDVRNNLEEGNTMYRCSHCAKYHQGKAKAADAPVIPENVQLMRYRAVWRRYHHFNRKTCKTFQNDVG